MNITYTRNGDYLTLGSVLLRLMKSESEKL